MDVLPPFDLERPRSLTEAHRLLAGGAARPLGGGTDILVNLRRGIGPLPSRLVDLRAVEELRTLEADGPRLRLGSSLTLAELAAHGQIRSRWPVLAQAAGSIAGPTHRAMATVGGNLCLDTRCVYYNQSEWWRSANRYCLKHRGSVCHVAPKSAVCYATFSGDLAPALLVLDAQVQLLGDGGSRRLPLEALYTGDGKDYLSLAPGEIVSAVEVPYDPALRSRYDKVRVRQSIDFPLAGVAVALSVEEGRIGTLRIAFTGTNPRPLLLGGLETLAGAPLDQRALGILDGLVRRQVMAMRTTFTSGHYRRRAAGVLARRLVDALHREACGL